MLSECAARPACNYSLPSSLHPCPPQMYGGMRGIRGLVTETSLLDPDEVYTTTHCWNIFHEVDCSLPLQGIRFRGYSIPECQEVCVCLSVCVCVCATLLLGMCRLYCCPVTPLSSCYRGRREGRSLCLRGYSTCCSRDRPLPRIR